jgi:xanthine/CO dehydrogenase XdhC/CoxF family maturation factor
VVAASSIAALRITAQDAVVVMTHSYEQDRAWLTALLPVGPRYLGLLGARHRSALLVREAAALLDWPVDRACEGLFAPVGLDLGGDGAEAIALAILSEMQACVEGKLGVSRRMTAEMVAEQIERGGASRYLQAQCAI